MPLQTRIDEINALLLRDAIPALASLTLNLTASISPVGQRLVFHPNYTSTADLNNLAKYWIRCATRCKDEHASFQLRLGHTSLDPLFKAFYEETEWAIREFEGGCCAHGAGEPAAIMSSRFFNGEALLFEADEYRQFGGGCDPMKIRYPDDCFATRAQVEEAMRRFAVRL